MTEPMEDAVAAARVLGRLSQGIGSKERLTPAYVEYCVGTLEDATVRRLDEALSASTAALPAVEARSLLKAGAFDAEIREYIEFHDHLPQHCQSVGEKLACVRGLHTYQLPGLAAEDLSTAPEAVKALCATLLTALDRALALAPASGGKRIRVLIAETGSPKATSLRDHDLVQLVADHPDRLDEITEALGHHGPSAAVLRERFETVGARALGEGWL